MSERNAILRRVREALRVPAPRPGSHDAVPAGRTSATRPGPEPRHHPRDFTPLLPHVDAGFEALAGSFTRAARELRADFHLLELEAGADLLLGALRDAAGWKRVASHHGELTTRISESLGLPVLWTDRAHDQRELEGCDVGITECDVLVAQTGSVVLTSASAGGRALSVLPPHHVVLARREQLVPDLPAAFRLLEAKYADAWPSMISFVTGPSRTGDIERILVLGAHGPKKLTVLMW